MDDLFSKLPARRFLVSSSDIPDETRDVDVGADDMLINALNQMNRRSGRYVFLDQARISGFGQLELVTTRKTGELKPNLYIRGAISQLDSDTVENDISFGHDTASGRGLGKSLYRSRRTLSIVSVDLHLVQYPSRQVLAGGSVANSMVVQRRGLNGTVAGVIDTVDFAVPISINRVESQGQAVRNLIELGLIELLGKHSGVPYWQCLGGESTDSRAAEQRERAHVRSGVDPAEVQRTLISLGYLKGTPSGRLDLATEKAIMQFQVAESLLPSGDPDFDFMERLTVRLETHQAQQLAQQRVQATETQPKQSQPVRAVPVSAPHGAAPAPRPAAPAAPATSPQCTGGVDCEGIYKNLYDFLKNDVEF